MLTYTDPICSCMLRTVHTGAISPPSGDLRPRFQRASIVSESCKNLVKLKHTNRANGWYQKTDQTVNKRPMWENNGALVLWTNNIFGHGRRRTGGWVLITQDRVRAYNKNSGACPTDHWKKISPKNQRHFQLIPTHVL